MVVQLPPGVNQRYTVLTVVTLVALWLWFTFDRLSHPCSVECKLDPPLSEQTAEVRDDFDFPPVNSESIKSICGETKWNNSVVFSCDKSVGGVGNIRNSILNCVRYAISAGAILVIPSIVLRNTSDISQIRTGVTTDFSYMFDTQHFLNSIRLSCPTLQIHLSRNDVKGFENTGDAISLLPESLVNHIPATGLPEPATWRRQFYAWLEQYSTPTVTSPMIIDLQRSYLQYPIYSDGEGFALSFVKALQSLADTYSLTLDLTLDVLPKTLFGAHLRTEKDATEGWPAPDWIYSRFETQSWIYLEQAPRLNSSVIYVASGDLDEVAKFAHNASTTPHNFTVTTKFDFLKGKDLEELQKLEWDQQGLVDYLVILKASDFAGIGHSSFAWNIALKRHIHATQKKHLDGPQMLSDDLSQIYGNVIGYPEYAASLWP